MPPTTHPADGRPTGAILSAAQQFFRLPDDELDRLLALTRQADRVELKYVVPEPSQKATCAALGVSLTHTQTRRVYFLDTPDLALDRHGIVARVRSIARELDDSVIKLRPVVPGNLPGLTDRPKRFVIEIDGMPGSYVCSATLKARLGAHTVERTMTGRRSLRTLFSKPQLRLLAAHAPGHVDVEDLTTFGPVDVRRCRLFPAGFGRPLMIEQWTYPDGSRILECSTRCASRHALHVAARTAIVLRRHGVHLTGPQQTKTRTTLDFFRRGHLTAGPVDNPDSPHPPGPPPGAPREALHGAKRSPAG